MTIDELRAQVLQLPAGDRAALAHDLLVSLDSETDSPGDSIAPVAWGSPEFEAAWVEEIERRAEAVERGEVETLDAHEVLAKLKAQFASKVRR